MMVKHLPNRNARKLTAVFYITFLLDSENDSKILSKGRISAKEPKSTIVYIDDHLPQCPTLHFPQLSWPTGYHLGHISA